MFGSLKQVLYKTYHMFRRDDCGFMFDLIKGHDDIKRIFIGSIASSKPVHVLLVGRPCSGKTMFLTEMMRFLKGAQFIVATHTTKSGLVNQLFERRPKFLCIDEIDKMKITEQASLLNLMETGLIVETKINKTRQMRLSTWVFATANSCEKILEPLLSRFLVLDIPEYTFEQFQQIALFKLKKEGVDEMTATMIVEKVWKDLASKDIRDVIKTARLVHSVRDVPDIIRIIGNYKPV
jgi:replication-associated recombination protein RarA